MPIIRIGGVTVVALLLAGCGKSGTGAATGPQTGSLTVTITAPQAATPAVTVTGPGGFQHTLNATATLTGLATGSYTIQAAPLSGAGPIVTTAFTGTVTGSPATVSANANATAAVTYNARPGSGGLWVMNIDIDVTQYAAAQLGSSTTAAPAASFGMVGTHYTAMAFDTAGNLWAPDIQANTVAEYSGAQLVGGASSTPMVLIAANSGSLNNPCGLAFDARGNLWVANSAANTVVAYTPSQLTTGGSPAPAVTLSANKGSLNFPCALAFDHAGNLWVGNQAGFTLTEYLANQLGTGGSVPPAVTITLAAPLAMAFDSAGDLWVGLYNFGLAALSPTQLATSGSPTPVVTIIGNGSPLREPEGLAFDNSGDLWVVNNGASTVMEYTPSQLAASGGPAPAVTVSGSLGDPVALAFNPHATNLPLRP